LKTFSSAVNFQPQGQCRWQGTETLSTRAEKKQRHKKGIIIIIIIIIMRRFLIIGGRRRSEVRPVAPYIPRVEDKCKCGPVDLQ
jgi:hypothetical protein